METTSRTQNAQDASASTPLSSAHPNIIVNDIESGANNDFNNFGVGFSTLENIIISETEIETDNDSVSFENIFELIDITNTHNFVVNCDPFLDKNYRYIRQHNINEKVEYYTEPKGEDFVPKEYIFLNQKTKSNEGLTEVSINTKLFFQSLQDKFNYFELEIEEGQTEFSLEEHFKRASYLSNHFPKEECKVKQKLITEIIDIWNFKDELIRCQEQEEYFTCISCLNEKKLLFINENCRAKNCYYKFCNECILELIKQENKIPCKAIAYNRCYSCNKDKIDRGLSREFTPFYNKECFTYEPKVNKTKDPNFIPKYHFTKPLLSDLYNDIRLSLMCKSNYEYYRKNILPFEYCDLSPFQMLYYQAINFVNSEFLSCCDENEVAQNFCLLFNDDETKLWTDKENLEYTNSITDYIFNVIYRADDKQFYKISLDFIPVEKIQDDLLDRLADYPADFGEHFLFYHAIKPKFREAFDGEGCNIWKAIITEVLDGGNEEFIKTLFREKEELYTSIKDHVLYEYDDHDLGCILGYTTIYKDWEIDNENYFIGINESEVDNPYKR
jgi:hypothetical protein